jgi:peroxiredoxin
MKIQPGQPAKNFSTEDISGKPVTLHDFKGKRLMLSFYRYAACPLCNLRMHQLIQQHASLVEKNLHLVAVFQSPKESILKYVGRQSIPFPVIADPGRMLYQLYGIESSWSGFIKGSLRIASVTSALMKGFFPGKMEGIKSMVPADFLIGPDLTVQMAYYGSDIGDHLPIEKIYQWLDNSQ